MIAVAAGAFVFLALSSAAVALLAPGRAPGASDERLLALSPREEHDELVTEGAPERRRPYSALPGLRGWLGRSGWAERTARELRQANIRLRVSEYLLARVLCGMLLAAGPFVLLGVSVAGVAIAATGGLAGFFAPAFVVGSARRRRVARIEKQLIDFLPALASSLRSGFAFVPAAEAAAQQTGAPLAGELAVMLNDVWLGADPAAALRDLGARVGSRDLDIVITAIQVQRTTGGNLPEILDGAAEALRERERIRGELQTFTAQQRMTGLILSVYPVAVGLLLLAIMPAVWSRLFTEPAGQVQLAIAVALQAIGFVAIRRALRIEV